MKPHFILENEEEEYQHQKRVQEIGEVKKGFTYKVERSEVLQRAELFLPVLGIANKYGKQISCDPIIEEIHDQSSSSCPHKEEKKEEEENKPYVEMNIALGILEHKEDQNEEEEYTMIEELN